MPDASPSQSRGSRTIDYWLETERLVLRPFTAQDAPALHAVVGNDPLMTWDGTHRSLEYVEGTVRERIEHYAVHGFGVLAVVEKETRVMMGQAGLQVLPKTGEVEIVAYTARPHWGTGYARETCSVSIHFGFSTLKLAKIVGVTRVENARALRLAENLGFRWVRDDFVYEADVKCLELVPANFRPAPGRMVVHTGSAPSWSLAGASKAIEGYVP